MMQYFMPELPLYYKTLCESPLMRDGIPESIDRLAAGADLISQTYNPGFAALGRNGNQGKHVAGDNIFLQRR